ncbi:hypothetical protein [Ruminococcus gauvreauii]|uniref:hypothetical protein n=1 Tax=Ruminococcus gauvreauii TaxID=438033 RepID=UPI003983F52C
MFRMWVKQWKNNRMVLDTVIENDSDDTRTHKILNGVVKACDDWDLGKPIWLDSNIQEFQRLGKTRFYQDNFIESIDFDHLEIQIIEE